MNPKVNAEIKKVIGRVKEAQSKLQNVLKSHDWVDEARKYADKQRAEVQKLLSTDIAKVKNFIEKERQDLEKFQKQIPGEVKKIKTLISKQRKELEKLLGNVRKAGAKSAQKKSRSTRAKKSSSTTNA